MINVSKNFLFSFLDYPDNHSGAVVIYFYGCEHSCKGCHNSEFKDVKGGDFSSIHQLMSSLISFSRRNRTNKIVFSGGDPLHPKNINLTRSLCDSLYKEYDICIYTGYDSIYAQQKGVKNFKFMKCGGYDETKCQLSNKTDSFLYLASRNQYIVDSKYNALSINGKYKFNN